MSDLDEAKRLLEKSLTPTRPVTQTYLKLRLLWKSC